MESVAAMLAAGPSPATKLKLWGGGAAAATGLLAALRAYSDKEMRRLRREDAAADAAHEARLSDGRGGKAESSSSKDKGKGKDGAKPARRAVDKGRFLKTIRAFLPIMCGRREIAFLVSVGGLLLVRTWMDFWMILHNARVLGTVANRDYKAFLTILSELVLMQLPISLVNNVLHFSIESLALGFQHNMTRHFHRLYMRNITFYSVSNLDSRIANADQLLTQDVKNFAESAANLYSNITKPLVDVVIFYYKLIASFGVTGPTSMLAYFVAAGAIMTRLRAPFGRSTAMQAKKEGDFRHVHSRVITYGEEIAFYGGADTEHAILNDRWANLQRHVRDSIWFKLNLGIFDSMITKYTATIIGYFVVTSPIFDPKRAAIYAAEPKRVMEDYTRYMRLIQAMVGAVGRLVDAGREMSHFAGYTERVDMLNRTLMDINDGKWERANVVSDEFVGKRGKISIVDDTEPVIRFDKVPIVTPNGDCLIREMSFVVRHGMNVMISGPNGCGKSSLFRVLGGLWPVFGGHLTRPGAQNLFYVPQKPYLAIGTFRDQITYPDTAAQVRAKGVSDDDLLRLLDVVMLTRVHRRHGGWDSIKDWADVLSGGEKQRVAMARLFYHKPQFAILDECTSQCSVDVEGQMYAHARRVGITLFTVSHRTTLWPFHQYLLKFDGERNYLFKDMEEADYPDALGAARAAALSATDVSAAESSETDA